MTLPILPKGYEWREGSYLVDVMIVVWTLRIVRVTPRKYWFPKEETVRVTELRQWGGDKPALRLQAWAGIAAAGLWKELEK